MKLHEINMKFVKFIIKHIDMIIIFQLVYHIQYFAGLIKILPMWYPHLSKQYELGSIFKQTKRIL